MKTNLKIAIVHDFLTKLGGAEKVLACFCEMFPKAPIYTILYDEEGTKSLFADRKIICSSLQKLPRLIRKRQRYLMARFPKAIEEFDFSGFDIVISSSNSYAHNIITPKNTFHLSYCYSPMRYVWDWYHQYLEENKIGYGLRGLIVRILLFKIRLWDQRYCGRANKYVAISKTVAKRINKYYRKNARVIYPPTEVAAIKQTNSLPENYYLIVSRIEPYKKIDLAVSAFNKLGENLKIIGVGSQENELKKAAKSNIEFLGWQSDDSVYEHMRKAKAFIFPGEEDYGITPVESMACGRPVIAFKKGGVTETVVDGKTGMFFDEETPESLIEATNKLDDIYKDISPDECRAQAEKFSREVFINKFTQYLEEQHLIFKKNA